MMLLHRGLIFGVLLSACSGLLTQGARFPIRNTKTKQRDFFKIDEYDDVVSSNKKAQFQWKWDIKKPFQIALMNKTTRAGIVIKAKHGRSGAPEEAGLDDFNWMQEGEIGAEEVDGYKAVVDPEENSITVGPSNTQSDTDLEESLDDFNFNPDEWLPEEELAKEDLPEETSEKESWLVRLLNNFCPSLVGLLMKVKGVLCKVIRFVLAPVFCVINVLGKVLGSAANIGWNVFSNGIQGFLNCFKHIFLLFSRILKGVRSMVSGGIRFALSTVLGAKDGALALFGILKSFSARINIMTIWQRVLAVPRTLCRYISGLGGMAVNGVTGVFGIFSKLFSLTVGTVLDVLKKFVTVILGCLSGKRPDDEELSDAADNLLEVSRQQKSKYRTHAQFRQYDLLMLAVKGERSFKIQGIIPVNGILGLLKNAISSAKEIVLRILNLLNPFAPMKSIVAQLFVDTIISLNSTTGPSYVKQLFPNIAIPEEALNGVNRNLAFDLIDSDSSIMDLPTPDMLKSIPIVKEIYREFDEAALEYTNSTLEYLLTTQYVETLADFTTKISRRK